MRLVTRAGIAFLALAGLALLATLATLVLGNGDPAPTNAGEPLVERRAGDLGFSVRGPRSWSADRREGVVRLRSAARRVALALTPVGGPGRSREVLVDAITGLRRVYEPVRMVNAGRARLGGRPALLAELLVQGADGGTVRVLVVTASSQWRTYLAQMFSTMRPSPAKLAEARAVLDSIEFHRPSGG